VRPADLHLVQHVMAHEHSRAASDSNRAAGDLFLLSPIFIGNAWNFAWCGFLDFRTVSSLLVIPEQEPECARCCRIALL
jgi:hypothetical protein